MTITSIQRTPASLPARAAAAPAPAEEQPPQLPSDQVVAFSKIDTPQEASQLPVLEPTFQFALVMGLAATLDPKQAASVYLSAKTQSGEVAFDQGTGLHKPDAEGLVGHGGGLVGQTYFEGNTLKLTPEGGLLFHSRFGETDTDLTIAKGAKGNTLKGKLGDVEADLTMNIVMDNTGLHINTSGTLGGQPYELKTDAGKDTWTSKGSLNGVAIDKTYATHQEPGPDGAKVVWQGHGTNAGMDQSVNFEMRVTKG